MSRGRREWVQFELKLAQGAEAWVIVRHRGGHFRVPLDCGIEELIRGVNEQWTGARRRPAAERTVRVTVSELRGLQAAAGLRSFDGTRKPS